jgi:acetamidase/formamidase
MLAAGCLVVAALQGQQRVAVSPSTVMWRYFSASAKPAVTVKPGETVEMDTICGDGPMLKRLGVKNDRALEEMLEIEATVKDHGPGPHFLTGPVYVEGAMPGDTLEVEIVDIRLRSAYGWMWIGPGAGALPEEYPYEREKLVPFDAARQYGEFAPGIRLPLKPFFGNLGVAPPEGRIGSARPGHFAGNLDNRWLVGGGRASSSRCRCRERCLRPATGTRRRATARCA